MDKHYKYCYKNLGLNISFYRKRCGFTQMQLSEMLDIAGSHLSAIELANIGA